MSLGALQSLNLSHNSFTGRIPPSIGTMRALESIDLSANQFDGEIPQSISNLTFLSFLNFSNNNLIGKIPLSTQMQSFEASSFTGNKLCGPPLPKNCTEIVPTPGSETGNEDEVDWLFYVSIAVGFIVGFWSIIGQETNAEIKPAEFVNSGIRQKITISNNLPAWYRHHLLLCNQKGCFMVLENLQNTLP
ncbi:hypothetical protein Q3G72_012386 [Acer saccharum]|nr:hypothetical protein Q3G72_012386 [Acer saccharum]